MQQQAGGLSSLSSFNRQVEKRSGEEGFLHVRFYSSIPDERIGQSMPEIPPKPQGPPFELALLHPPGADHFLGRVDEVAWVHARLLAGGVTGLTGVPGVGKTALVAVAVRELHDRGHFREGIGVVDCRGKTDGGAVLQDALGHFDPYRRQPDTTGPTGLGDAARRLLSGKDTLLILDNVEPGLDVERLLDPLEMARASVLVTARQVLPLPAEAQLEVRLLSQPDALQLLLQSAGHASSTELAPEELDAARQIMDLLARHTYALQLAGAYAFETKRSLTMLAAELADNPLRIPQGEEERAVGKPFLLSLNVLPPSARRLFVLLSALATTDLGRQALLAVAGAQGIEEADRGLATLMLRALVDIARIGALPKGSDRDRLIVHPLLQTQGKQQFAAWPAQEQRATGLVATRYYADYASRSPDEALGVDEEQLVQALEWAQAHHQLTLVAELCSHLQYFWRHRGRIKASLRYLPWGIAAARALIPRWMWPWTSRSQRQLIRKRRLQLANLEYTYGSVLQTIGQLDRAQPIFERNLARWRQLHDRQGEGAVLTALGQVAQIRGQLDVAEGYFQRALVIHREVHDRWGEGMDLGALGQVALRHGQLEQAEAYFQQALATDREAQNRQEEGTVLGQLGELAKNRGQLDQAEQYSRASLAISREQHDRSSEGAVLFHLGSVAQARGQLDTATEYFQQALDIHQELGNRRGEGSVLTVLGQVTMRRGQFDAAERYFRQALAIDREVENRREEGIDLTALGRLALRRGRLDVAEDYFLQALAIDREAGNRWEEGVDLTALGQLARARGQFDVAERYFRQALAIDREVGNRREEGIDLTALGQLARDRGRLEEAEGYFQQALAIGREVGNQREEGMDLRQLALIAEARGEMDQAESLFRQSLASAIEAQDALGIAGAKATLGEFLVGQRGQRAEGCRLLAEAAQFYHEQDLPEEADVRAMARRLGCVTPPHG
jgi:tetratricopeptide (TPR) repeat protein